MVGKEQLDIENPEKVGWPEQEKAREELLALQYQINPHFLYNSLNSIRWMAMMTNNTKVADSLVILCKVHYADLEESELYLEAQRRAGFPGELYQDDADSVWKRDGIPFTV